MEKIAFTSVWDHDINQSVRSLVNEASKLKAEIFKGVVMDQNLNEKNIKLFEAHINEFLRFWTDHANQLNAAMRQVEISDKCELRTIDYDYVKNFIYAKYDYSSVLQFADGLIKGIEDDKLDTPEKIEEFREHTINLAFNKQSPTVAGLLNSVLPEEIGADGNKQVTIAEAKMFNNVRNYDSLFRQTDRAELFRATMKVIEYLTKNDILKEEKNYQNIKLFVSLVNNVVEYITYSMTAYATRIFIISRYANPFIQHQKSCEQGEPDSGESMAEKVMNFDPKDLTENPEGSISSILQNTDEMIIKDPSRAKEYFDRFSEFLKFIGADTLFGDDRMPTYGRRYFDRKWWMSNKFHDKLQDNPFYTYLRGIKGGYSPSDSDIMEMHTNLKGFMYNKYQGLQGPTTERQEILHIIRGTEYEESVKGYKEMAKDLYLVALEMNDRISEWLKHTTEKSENEFNANRLPIGGKKFLNECTKFLIEWYEESMFAIAQKAYFIERRINDLRSSELKQTMDKFAIKIPDVKNDANLDDYTASSIPSTMRMPIEHIDLYALPVFEYLEMCDTWYREQAEFKDDWYFSEAMDNVRYSQLVNTIISFLQSVGRKINDFIFRNLKPATEWVTRHKQELLEMKFSTTAKIDHVFLYDINMDLNSNNGLKAIVDPIIENLKAFSPEKDPDEFYKGFFKDTAQQGEVEGDPKMRAEMRRRSVLFKDTSDQSAKAVTLTGPQINEAVKGWVNDVSNAAEVGKRLNTWNNEILNAFNAIKPKLINPPAKTEATEVAADGVDPKQQTEEPVASAGAQAPGEGGDKMAAGGHIGKIHQAVNVLWTPVHQGVCIALRHEYEYLKLAYGIKQ